jgi:hypothetical protein
LAKKNKPRWDKSIQIMGVAGESTGTIGPAKGKYKREIMKSRRKENG